MDKKILRHLVLLKFEESLTEEDIKNIEEAFLTLPDKIPSIEDFEWGTNESPIDFDKGFTHCFLVTFKSEEGLSKYLPHPEHQAISELLEPHTDDMLILDYWAQV